MKVYHVILLVLILLVSIIYYIPKQGTKECMNDTLMIYDGYEWVFYKGANGGYISCI